MEGRGVLVLAEQRKGQLHPISYELLGKGREIADRMKQPLICLVMGPSEIDTQELIARGADQVFHMMDPELFCLPNERTFAQNALATIRKIAPAVCLIGATTLGRSIAPRIAAALSVGLTADCTGLSVSPEGQLIQIRPAFSGNILAHIVSNTVPRMATVRFKEFPEALRDPRRSGEVIKLPPVFFGDEKQEVLAELSSAQKSISDYEVVVAGGAGIKQKEDLALLQRLADRLGGTVGASRALVDIGIAAKAQQVGYSGNRVKPRLYIACGISGAPQHLAGMKEAEMVIAINSDPTAPIFSVADYGIVGDLYQVIPKLLE